MTDKRVVITSASVYLSLVAWPGAAEQEQRQRFINAVVAATADLSQQPPPPELPPYRRDRIGQQIERGMGTRIMNRRLPAAALASRRLAAMPHSSAIRSLLTHLGDKVLTQGLGLDPGKDDRGDLKTEFEDQEHARQNAQRLIWKESLPALPMIFPLIQVLNGGHGFDALPFRSDWVPWSVAEAQRIAPMLAEVFGAELPAGSSMIVPAPYWADLPGEPPVRILHSA